MAAWLSVHAPWGLEMDGAAIAQTHATSSKADLQHTHVPVKSRGSPEAGTEETHVRGLHSQRGGLPCTPPTPRHPCQPHGAQAGPGPVRPQLPEGCRPSRPLSGLQVIASSPPHPWRPSQPSGLTPASEHQPPEGSPRAGRRGGQEARQVDSFCQQPAEVGHGGKMGGGHGDLAQNLRANNWVRQSRDGHRSPTQVSRPAQAPRGDAAMQCSG